MAKNWIAGAIKHPGALHRQLGVPQGQKIPKAKINAAAEKGGVLGQRARLAQTLSGLRSHMPKGASLSPKGDIGAHRQAEARSVGTFKGAKDYKSAFPEGKPNQTMEPFLKY